MYNQQQPSAGQGIVAEFLKIHGNTVFREHFVTEPAESGRSLQFGLIQVINLKIDNISRDFN